MQVYLRMSVHVYFHQSSVFPGTTEQEAGTEGHKRASNEMCEQLNQNLSTYLIEQIKEGPGSF